MLKIEKNNKKIGEYLSNLIESKYKSRREFCREYIKATGEEPTDETLNNMSNRLTQIVKGNKAIQAYDLLYCANLLGVSCEQILSAGEISVPVKGRMTNYAIATSKKPEEWEKYINHPDKLILNADEYCKTVLDYAIEFRNYEFIKYLMQKKYIWFDSGDDRDYVTTFGAGTSIKHRDIRYIDYGLESKLMEEDQLRINMITLAVDNEDIEMLDNLRARENPQLYIKTRYGSVAQANFSDFYNERMVRHIADAGENVIDYFTDPFEIKDVSGNSERNRIFMFPHISILLDLLISNKSFFAETAIKKALKHNKDTYKKICKIISNIKNDEYYAAEYMKQMLVDAIKQNLAFYDNNDIVSFMADYSNMINGKKRDMLITNVPHVTKIPTTPVLRCLVEELNESYEAIKNIKEHLEEI